MALDFKAAEKKYLKNIVVDQNDPSKSFIKEIKFTPKNANKEVTKYAVSLPMVGEDGKTTNRYQFYVNKWQITMTSSKRAQIEFNQGDSISVRKISRDFAGKDGITTMKDAKLDPKDAEARSKYFTNVKLTPDALIEDWKKSSANYRKANNGKDIEEQISAPEAENVADLDMGEE